LLFNWKRVFLYHQQAIPPLNRKSGNSGGMAFLKRRLFSFDSLGNEPPVAMAGGF